MNRKYFKWILFLAALLVLLLVSVLFSLSSGEVKISLSQLPQILSDNGSIEYTVLTKIRIPRILLAIGVGGALSLSGVVLQGIYRNPLVEPYTLGISGGAALGVAVAIVFGLNALSFFSLPAFGFVGALFTLFVVYFLSIKRGGLSINSMLLIGVMVSFVSSSAMMFLMSISTSDNLHNIVFWVMGSLDESNNSLIAIAFYSSLAGLAISYFFAQTLNALRLGEVKARHLGINTGLAIKLLFFVASLLTGIAVSVAGVIGFVGLVIPHVIRLVIGNDYRILLAGSFLGGAIFLILSDIIARTIISPNELPIGVITGFVGGLVFIIVLSRSKSHFKLN
ncbi:FecCD family ABC transporter permease [Draconibacterium halophilum]|uniref:Iron ABC transporter permease n=1 Tax=Draconibacterium halophilum TaxID=2706887 RepID=A0A6C0RHJ7_9BACT|nr:iron ABC transporter permease [Draconibacterium halophilum]QIA09003.1 iron ABC transporter permease [Draconibacterium halophilum]